jgi:YrbI family 3-deoxy-D-manno-octulosonate 8-phosphate phosphatase
MVQFRAELLGVKYCYVGRDKKLDILEQWRQELELDWSEIAYLGDDINDREIMQKVGIAVCPKNAVRTVKSISTIHLTRKGGDACFREFVDDFLLSEPLN